MALWSAAEGAEAGAAAWEERAALPPALGHAGPVHRLSFRPEAGPSGGAGEAGAGTRRGFLQLASCGADHTVRIFDVRC